MNIRLRILFFVLIPCVLLPLVFVYNGSPPLRCLYMLLVMAAFWFLDVLPYGVTSILPVMFAPLMGIASSAIIAPLYSTDSLMLCLGRLIMACAFQQQQVHRRFGLFLLNLFGSHPRWIMLGCMLPSYILTMFISNTATAPIMLEFALEILQVIQKIEEGVEIKTDFESSPRNYGIGENTPINSRHVNPADHLRVLQNIPNGNWESEYPSMLSVIDRSDSHKHFRVQQDLAESLNADPTSSDKLKHLSKAICLATGYAASSGAVATIVACGPNLVLYGIVQSLYEFNSGLNYASFMFIGLPMSVVTLALTWFWVGIFHLGPRAFLLSKQPTEKDRVYKEKIREMKENLGPISFPELSCIGLTCAVIVLWITRQLGQTKGWGFGFVIDNKMLVSDSTPMILVIVLFYIWPAKPRFWKLNSDNSPGSERLLTWDATHKNLPWSIIFLLGAGFAMTKMCQLSGLSSIVGDALFHLKGAGYIPLIFLASALSCVSTEFLSSTSALPIYIAIFNDLACKMNVHPFLFLFPLTFSASYAFCLPAATTPNIAIFNRGLATTPEMLKTGLLMDIVFIVIVSVFTIALVPPIFHTENMNPIFQNCSHL